MGCVYFAGKNYNYECKQVFGNSGVENESLFSMSSERNEKKNGKENKNERNENIVFRFVGCRNV